MLDHQWRCHLSRREQSQLQRTKDIQMAMEVDEEEEETKFKGAGHMEVHKEFRGVAGVEAEERKVVTEDIFLVGDDNQRRVYYS